MDLSQISQKFFVKDLAEWTDVNADLIITDPPFGINFDGKPSNYKRKKSFVVDGYVDWPLSEYPLMIEKLLQCIHKNLKTTGQALIFSGWNNSNIIHNKILESNLILRGKLYWVYNFASFCTKKPSHNVYEIFWVTKGDSWVYNNKCSTSHCVKNEPNLSALLFKREFIKKIIKYPTKLPFELVQCLIEHFSREGDLVFDPLCGSGIVGIVSFFLKRDFLLGDINPNAKKVFLALFDYYSKKNL